MTNNTDSELDQILDKVIKHMGAALLAYELATVPDTMTSASATIEDVKAYAKQQVQALIQADRTAQKQRLLEALPEKQKAYPDYAIDRENGYNHAIDQCRAIVEGEV